MTRGRPLSIAWNESADELHRRYRAEAHPARRMRLQALWLLRQGKRIGEVKLLLGVHYRTVQQWLAWYRQGGLDEVLRRVPGHHAQGRPSLLTAAQRKMLFESVVAGQFESVGEVVVWIREHWGISYSYKGVYSLLQREARNSRYVFAWSRRSGQS